MQEAEKHPRRTEPRLVLLTLRMPRGDDDVPALRRLLKCLLRSFNLRCVAVRPADEEDIQESEIDQ